MRWAPSTMYPVGSIRARLPRSLVVVEAIFVGEFWLKVVWVVVLRSGVPERHWRTRHRRVGILDHGVAAGEAILELDSTV